MPEVDMGEFSSFESAWEEIKRNHSTIVNYDTPWWGDKETESGNLNNRGFVIGFQDSATNARWRLDYDETKKLHINWSQKISGQETTEECYRIFSIRPQDTLSEYYISWTDPRVDDIPPDIKARLDKVGGVKKWTGRYWEA